MLPRGRQRIIIPKTGIRGPEEDMSQLYEQSFISGYSSQSILRSMPPVRLSCLPSLIIMRSFKSALAWHIAPLRIYFARA